MASRYTLNVDCRDVADGWQCTVLIAGDGTATRHQVAMTTEDRARYAPAGVTADDLVRASFAFLLERESPRSILRAFELPIIGRYFPEYEAEIRSRLGG